MTAVYQQKGIGMTIQRRLGRHCGPLILLVLGLASAQGQETRSPQGERNRRLFTKGTLGGNGRTCDTCHSLRTSDRGSRARACCLNEKSGTAATKVHTGAGRGHPPRRTRSGTGSSRSLCTAAARVAGEERR